MTDVRPPAVDPTWRRTDCWPSRASPPGTATRCGRGGRARAGPGRRTLLPRSSRGSTPPVPALREIQPQRVTACCRCPGSRRPPVQRSWRPPRCCSAVVVMIDAGRNIIISDIRHYTSNWNVWLQGYCGHWPYACYMVHWYMLLVLFVTICILPVCEYYYLFMLLNVIHVRKMFAKVWHGKWEQCQPITCKTLCEF